jgi:hypothetical protein
MIKYKRQVSLDDFADFYVCVTLEGHTFFDEFFNRIIVRETFEKTIEANSYWLEVI